MLIGSKLPPLRTDRTFFSSGRAAFAFLVGQVVRPRRVHLPAFTCWSLVSTMQRRFPEIPVEFYPVDSDLTCTYPARVEPDELFVFIHYFGHRNTTPLPECEGTLLEDVSHSYLSDFPHVGDWVFGSYRKIQKVADGGFINARFNPVYEPSRRLDTWLRLEATDWRDVREAENMIDRDWQVSDISSQSLAVLLTENGDLIRQRRRANERFLAENLTVGRPQLTYRDGECPLLHNRLMESKDARDSLRAFLAERGVFTSIHWPTHEMVKEQGRGVEEAVWIEDHVLSIPVSHEYGENDMEFIARCADEWERAGR